MSAVCAPVKSFPEIGLGLGLFVVVSVGWIYCGRKRKTPSFSAAARANTSTFLWYNTEASKWDEALPVGNGRLGAMVFGKVDEEQIQLNEDTYWSGGPYTSFRTGGHGLLSTIQRKVFEENYMEAHNLFGRNLMGYPVEQQKYQSLANLHLNFSNLGMVADYKRSLDLESGVASTSFTAENGVQFNREVLASAPHQAIAVRLTANELGKISFSLQLRGVRNQAHSNYGTDYFAMDFFGDDGLALTGKSADYLGVVGRVKYEVRVKVVLNGGSIAPTSRGVVGLTIENANSATIYVVAATNFVSYKDVSADQHQIVSKYWKNLDHLTYAVVRDCAVSDHRRLFCRASLTLGSVENSFLPTNQRKEMSHLHSDPSLAALAYNFGRYILISSSRPQTQPSNLQGIWNNDMNPSWDSKYTTNINMEMNYWAVHSANLSELAEPLVTFIREISDQGTRVAQENYGASRGWVFHQNTDIWRVAAPMDGPTWGTFTVGGAWLCTHLWEHFEYTQDRAFLAGVYPLMEGAVHFFLDFLVMHPNGKWLVTNPSTSPENFPSGGGNGPYFDEVTGCMLPGTTICAGSSIDMQILFDLFGYYEKASRVLNIDSPSVDQAKRCRGKLVPPQIGSDGSLQEWADDWTSLEKSHRHFSHLYGLYPGKVLWEKRTPALIEAYKQVLNERGDSGKGFSMAWKMALWARLKDGDRSSKIFRNYLREQSCCQLFAKCGSTLQVDGALGMTAAITEMLVQTQDGYIELLPALPSDWTVGEFKGVCARGGFELDFEWVDGCVRRAMIASRAGRTLRIKVPPKISLRDFQWTHRDAQIVANVLENEVIEFPTSRGETYFWNKFCQ